MRRRSSSSLVLLSSQAERNAARREANALNQSLRLGRIEHAQRATENFMKKHGKKSKSLTVSERRRLRSFFERLDVDGSGHISVEELIGPLLGVGMADSEADVRAFVNRVDTDRSGLIDLDEFVRAVEAAHKEALSSSRSLPNLPSSSSHRGAAGRGALPLVRLQRQRDDQLDMSVRISMSRRHRLLETIQNTLPNTAKIEAMRHEEAHLRMKLQTSTQDRQANKCRLARLQRDRRKVQRDNVQNAKLISALEHAVRVDQSTLFDASCS